MIGIDHQVRTAARGRCQALARHRAAAALLVTLGLVASACSVSTPRDGFTEAAEGRVQERDVVGTQTPSVGADLEPGETAGPEAIDTATGDRPTGGNAPASGGRPATDAGRGSTEGTGTATSGPAAPAVGVTTDKITISLIAGWGGIFGPILEDLYQQAIVTWQNEVNSSGGIHGRQVVIKRVDHKETTDGGVAACREVQANATYLPVTIQGLGDGNLAAASCLEKAGFTNIAFLSELPASWRHTYAYIPVAHDYGWSLASLVKNVMHDGDKKLGLIYVTQPVYFAARDGFVPQAEALGMNVAATEAVEPNQGSFTPQLLRLREAGVEHLTILAGLEAIGILRDARAMGWRPRFSGTFWHFDVYSEAARDLMKDAHVVREFVTTDGPKYQEFEEKRRRYSPNTTRSNGEALIIYGLMDLVGHALRAAGPNPTANSLETALHSVKDYDNGILPAITWGPNDGIGTRATFPAICCTPNWRWQGLGPAREQH